MTAAAAWESFVGGRQDSTWVRLAPFPRVVSGQQRYADHQILIRIFPFRKIPSAVHSIYVILSPQLGVQKCLYRILHIIVRH